MKITRWRSRAAQRAFHREGEFVDQHQAQAEAAEALVFFVAAALDLRNSLGHCLLP